MISLKTIRNLSLILSVVLLSAGVGYQVGRQSTTKKVKEQVVIIGATPADEQASQRMVDFSLFWQVWQSLAANYLDKSALDAQKMVYGAIAGMVSALDDPYTVFLTPQENKEAKDELGGQFEGIGAQLGIKEKRIIVVAPLSGMPAQKAGIKAGDTILKVDGEDTITWSLPKAVSKIRGPKGTTVTLTILREDNDEPFDVAIVRDTILVSSVKWERLRVMCEVESGKCEIIANECPDCIGVAYLELSRFGDNTQAEWEQAVNEIAGLNCGSYNVNCRGVILDLRNNPGGYLQGSVYIASEFLEKGVVVIQEHSDGSQKTLSVNRRGKLLNVPLIVLVNKGSASASEIVAGSLKTNKRAKLVGETTFGKGSVQETEDLQGGAGLHITVARWLLPDRSHLNGVGVEPDVIIEGVKDEGADVQLEKAVEVLTVNN